MGEIFCLYAEVPSQIPTRMPSALRNLVTCSACSGQIVRQKLRRSSHIFLHLFFTYYLLNHVFPTHGQLACIKKSGATFLNYIFTLKIARKIRFYYYYYYYYY